MMAKTMDGNMAVAIEAVSALKLKVLKGAENNKKHIL